jgi:nucleoside-diphosphate-sugar epimerase
MKNVLIIGCGDIGRRVARRLQAGTNPGEVQITGLVRAEQSAQGLIAMGVTPRLADLAQAETLQGLPSRDATVFYFAPPPAQGESDPYLGNFLAAIRPNALPEKLVLLSTTAVYGDCQGEWITEETPADPQTPRGRRRLDAESRVRAWCGKYRVPFVILRVGGIYGPGRWPLARLQKGLPILREAESPYTNRIHQDDLAQICIAAAQRGKSGEIYNVADGQPGTMSAYFKAVAQHFGLPRPREVGLAEAQQVMSPGMLSYLRESRRIDNRKLLTALQLTLRYPDLSAGLAADKSSDTDSGRPAKD